MPTAPPSITTLPAAPDPNNRTTFNSLAYPWSAALPTFGTQVSAVGANVKANADEAEADAVATAADRVQTGLDKAATAADRAQTGLDRTSATNSAAAAAASAAVASGAAAFVDTNPVVKGSVDATKQVRFEVDGLTTGTTRVLTVPDADMTLVGLATTQTLTNKTLASPMFTGPINEVRGSDIASASTINLTTSTGNLVDVTGTTTITAITLADGAERTVRFTGALTLTNGASLVLPGGANITAAAGDFATFRGYAAGVVRCSGYVKASGAAVVAASGALVYLSTVTASAASSVDVETGFGSTYDDYIIIGSGVFFSGAGGLAARMKISGSYVTSSAYSHHVITSAPTATAYASIAGQSQAESRLQGTNGGATVLDNAMSFQMNILSVNSATYKTARSMGIGNSGEFSDAVMKLQSSTGVLSGIRFLNYNGGTLTGTFKLYGVAKS